MTPAAERIAVTGRLTALLRELAVAPEAALPGGAPGPGTVVGRFELVREIGRGGFGVVYEARDRELGRDVAIKLVRPLPQPDLREERLVREAEAAAGLSHQNIVTLHDAGRCEYGPYLVFELLRGQTLARRLTQGVVPLREALRMGVEVARAMAHAHATGIVHRDLKPANVFLCDGGAVKVLDLGLAHAFGRRRLDGGTPGYMAPEQVRGAPEDERTDVWALGAVLHRMLAGEDPFREGRKPGGEPPLLEVQGAPALGGLVARMLDPDPVKRPRDAGEVLSALLACQQELERAPSSAEGVRRRRLGPRLRRSLALGLATSLAVVVLGLAIRHLQRPDASPAEPSIAVLPFADLSPNGDQEYFSDGLADEILGALAQVEGVRVPGRSSSFFFKGNKARYAEIGRELGVAAVLEGSVRRAGNRVRVTAQVVNVKDGFRRWAETYDLELTDIFAVQREIARAVVQALGVEFRFDKLAGAPGLSTGDPEAYTLYLVGRQEQRRLTHQGFRKAAESHERALALDPGFAPAWAGLAGSLFYLASWEESAEGAQAVRHHALAAAEKAVAIAPDLPEALAVRATLRSALRREWTEASEDLARALRLSGNDPDIRRRYAILLLDVGRLPEAEAEARRAIGLDPLGQAWVTLGTILQDLGRIDEADAAYRRHLRISPDSLAGLVGLGRNQLLQGRPAEALATFERTADEPYRLWGQAAARHAMGDEAASRAALRALAAGKGQAEAFDVAELHAWRGEPEAALDWLEKAHARREETVTGEIAFDPFLKPLRDHPRFHAMLRSLNLPAAPPAPARPR